MTNTTRKWILLIHAFNLLSFGLPLLLLSDFVFEMYGLVPGDGLRFMARMMGSVALGNVVMSWLVRQSDWATVQRPFFINQTVAWAGTFLAGLTAMLGGALNGFGWMFVVNPLFWVLLFGYLSWQVTGRAVTRRIS